MTEEEDIPESVDTIEDTMEVLADFESEILNKRNEIFGVFDGMDTTSDRDDFDAQITRIFLSQFDLETAGKIRTAIFLSMYNVRLGDISNFRESNLNSELIEFFISLSNRYGDKYLSMMQQSSVGEKAWKHAETEFRFNDDSQMLIDYNYHLHNGDSFKVSNTFTTNMSLLSYFISRQEAAFSHLNEETYRNISTSQSIHS